MEQHRCMGCMAMTENEICEKCGWPNSRTNEPHQLPVGYVLHGQYRIGRVLGQGGFGITYLGWDDFLEIPVAIKEFYPNSMVNRECSMTTKVHCYTEQVTPQYVMSKERFLREAKALARFEDEPAIVRIRNFFQENDTAYIVMEYVRGTDLASYVNMRGGKLSPKETFAILRPVMDALAVVHGADLVHRDISPDNIMLHPRGGAKLLDFGAVRSVEGAQAGMDMQRSTEAILKHGFAPMEQYQTRGGLGPWTDEYALCATIYYCLTGKIPEEAPRRMLEEIELNWDIPGLTERQKAALSKGMSLRSRDRFGSVDALIRELYGPDENSWAVSPSAAQSPRQMPPSAAQPPRQMPPSAAQPPRQMPSSVAQAPRPVPEARKKPAVKKKKKSGVLIAAVGAAAALLVLVVFLMLPNGWRVEDGAYRYYKAGFKLTNAWHREGGSYYYFGENGDMATSWELIDGVRYYFGEDGVMVKNWQTIDGAKYYFGTDGVLVTGEREIDGVMYRFREDGALCIGWQEIGGKRYYFSEDGTAYVGMHRIGTSRYYFEEDGAMATGWKSVDKITYYFDEDGTMHTGWLTLNGKKFYFDDTGRMLTGLQRIRGMLYYFDYYGQLIE